ncbi:hypothetical protein CcCBS67573_g05271 [Chytriomyces confervae]|uniref:BZIP domain-containing protein n=1 Tax=Chytriomyces confervae TaxID=246404 RepID=A0A507FDV1_9FUNG|nr:hypothetical protein CcCBS67573_g05271 [Chytriomyces confervae]
MPDGDAAADGYEELSGEDCYDTRSPRQRRKPGRKQTTSEPLTKKQEQTRRAQRFSFFAFNDLHPFVVNGKADLSLIHRLAARNFRERQQKYVQSLEGKAEELAAVMAQERKEAAELRSRITQLEMDLANAVAAGSNPQTSNPRTEHCTSSACAAERSLLVETVGDLRLEIDSMRVRMEKAGRLVASPPPPHQTKLAQISSLSEGATEVLAPSMSFSPSSQTSPQSSRHAFHDAGWNDDSTKIASNSPVHPFPYNHSPPPPPTNKVKSATETYGSPQVEFARQMCKSIPSLANLRAWYKVFDAVKDVPAERKSLLEVDEVFHLINKDHMNHFYSIAAFAASNSIRPPRSLSTSQTESWTLSLQNLRIDLYSLPSLSQSQVLIETLLETFSRPASLGFFENSALVRQLERQCNSEDRGLFLSALYKLRTADKVMHDAAFEQVLISLDGIAI